MMCFDNIFVCILPSDTLEPVSFYFFFPCINPMYYTIAICTRLRKIIKIKLNIKSLFIRSILLISQDYSMHVALKKI
eukprot:UN12723